MIASLMSLHGLLQNWFAGWGAGAALAARPAGRAGFGPGLGQPVRLARAWAVRCPAVRALNRL